MIAVGRRARIYRTRDDRDPAWDDAVRALPKRRDASGETRVRTTRTQAGPQKLVCPPRVPAPATIRAKAPALTRDGVWADIPGSKVKTTVIADNDGEEGDDGVRT